MRIFGLVGRSGAGKTTLLEKIVPILRERGRRVSTMKHTHHDFDIDRPGKDSHRHRAAGADQVMVVCGRRWALTTETPETAEPDIDALIGEMAPTDVLLIEGFHAHSHPKIEVHRPSLGHALMWRPGGDVVAVACDEPPIDAAAPTLDLNSPAAIVDFILDDARWDRASS
ncbi:MAG: molybdopterin-guanine dinucleotide biosynthesis protein B [Phyllobacteriaceae bacterium]|nr:molybdopterin-guanine dinucleotide biosynthesis protein B [Phyllobacteriaceae bacterium]